MNQAALKIELDAEAVQALAEATVREMIEQLGKSGLPGLTPAVRRLAYSEAEAARMLGLKEHQLRDERREGKIQASQIRGRRIRYTEEDLRQYLAGRRYEPE